MARFTHELIIFAMASLIALPALGTSEGDSCQKKYSGLRASRGRETHALKPSMVVANISREIERNPHHLLGVFQPEDQGRRTIPAFVAQLFSHGKPLSLDEMKEKLKAVDPAIYDLTEKIVRKENLEMYMLRHPSPEEMAKDGKKFFESKLESVGVTDPTIPNAMAVAYGSKDWVDEALSPKHSFLWFKKMPRGMKIQMMYRRVARGNENLLYQLYGEHLYRLKLEQLSDRTLYTLGDFLFTLRRNAADEKRRLKSPDEGIFDEKTLNQMASQKSNPFSIFEGTFPIDDLRGLFLYVFSTLKAEKDYTKKLPKVLYMPAREVIETTVWGPLSVDNVDYQKGVFIDSLHHTINE